MSSERREGCDGRAQAGAGDFAALAGTLAAAAFLCGCSEADNRAGYCYRTTCENGCVACCPFATPGVWDPSSGSCTCDAADAEADGDEGPDADADEGPDADGDEDADADGDVGTDTLTFRVLDGRTGEPLDAVDVLVQTSAGEEWLVTDLDGSVTIDGLDLAGDPPTVTFFKRGYAFLTCVGVDRQLLEPVTLLSQAEAPQIVVTGTVAGLTDTQRAAVSVWRDTGLFRHASTAEPLDDYATRFPVGTDWEQIVGQAFAVDLTTGELQNHVRGSAAYSCPAEPCPDAVLDFAMPAEPPAMTHRRVTLAYPTGSDVFPSTPFVPVGDDYIGLFNLWGDSDTDGARVGTTERVEASMSPRGLTARVGWLIDLGGYAEADVVVTFQIPGSENYDLYCEMQHPGLPAEDETINMLEPPVFTTPADLGTAFSLSRMAATWNVPAWASYAQLWLYSSDLQTPNWLVFVPRRVTTFRFPSPPASFPAMSFPMRLGIFVRGFAGAPESCWELMNMGDTFTGRFVGSLWDARHRAVR